MRRREPREVERRGARGAGLCPLVAVVVLALSGPVAAESDTRACAPWPGEPAPLPAVTSPDPILARWAALRTVELEQEASRAEHGSPARANRLWRHALCLDPGSARATTSLTQTPLVRVHRPVVAAVHGGTPGRPAAAGSSLDDPIRVAVSRPPPSNAPSPRPPDWSRTDAALRSAEEKLRDADFEAALVSAQRLSRQLGSPGAEPGARARKARAEIVAATAQVALGRDEEARRSFDRALQADPALRLDPATTSPKVRRAFDAAVAAQKGAR